MTTRGGGVMEHRRACDGAETVPVRSGPEYGQRCVECGSWVRDDMVDHPLFGWSSMWCPLSSERQPDSAGEG